MNTKNELEVLRYADLDRLGYGSRVTIWTKVRSGEFLPPRDILGRPGWLRDELETYKKSRPQISYGMKAA